MKFPRSMMLAACAGLLAAAAAAQSKKNCPVDDKPIADATKAPVVQVNRKRTAFCYAKCLAAFRQNPEKHLKDVAPCPVLGSPVPKIASEGRLTVNNNLYYFCCDGCKAGFTRSPAHLKKQVDVVSGEVFETAAGSPQVEYKGQYYLFVTEATKATFEKSPEKYAVLYGK